MASGSGLQGVASARDDDAAADTGPSRIVTAAPASVENLFRLPRLRRVAEQLASSAIDRRRRAVAVSSLEKARVAPDKIVALVGERPARGFSPSGVLRLELSEDEADNLIEPSTACCSASAGGLK